MSDQSIYCTLKESESITCNVIEEVIEITVEGSGEALSSDVIRENLIFEDLTSQVDGIKTDFIASNKFYSDRLAVYVNGLRERGIVILSSTSFRLTLALDLSDSLEVEYVKDAS